MFNRGLGTVLVTSRAADFLGDKPFCWMPLVTPLKICCEEERGLVRFSLLEIPIGRVNTGAFSNRQVQAKRGFHNAAEKVVPEGQLPDGFGPFYVRLRPNANTFKAGNVGCQAG